MNTNKLSTITYSTWSLLILIMLGLTACGITQGTVVETVPAEIGAVDTPMKEAGAVEISTSEVGIEPTPMPGNLTYTNNVYGFEFEYPGTWTLKEEDHGVVLIKGRNRLGIRFRGIDEDADRFSGRTGIPAGELIYSDKIRFMGRVIPAEVLVFEQKSKIVFYGGTGRIEIDELVFSITLDDRETYNYRDVDLSEELLT